MNRETAEEADATVPGGDAEHERRPGLRTVGTAVSRLAAPVVARHGGGTLARLKTEWPAIVGADFASATWPQSLSRDGVLKLRVAAAMAIELQHRAPLLIERIGLYLGRPAVSRLAFVQGPLPFAAGLPPIRPDPVREADAEDIDRQLAAIADPELRAALARLGRSVTSGSSRRR